MTVDQYLEIVDATGRVARRGQRASPGTIPEDLLPILDRLDLDAERWTTVMATTGRMFGSAIGGAASRAAEAVRRRARWIVGALDVYRTT